MLRCLENCNKTAIFCVLFNLLRRHKESPSQVKLPGLIIKCLLKLSKILEKLIAELNIENVLIVIHLYLISINHEKKTSNDEMGIRIVKTLVHEMVKEKKRSILDAYKVVGRHEVEDKHLHRWINIILNTLDPQEAGGTMTSDSSASGSHPEREIAQIITELKSTDTFQTAISKLHNFLAKNPRLSLETYIRDLSQHMKDMIRSNLESYRNSLCKYTHFTLKTRFSRSVPPIQLILAQLRTAISQSTLRTDPVRRELSRTIASSWEWAQRSLEAGQATCPNPQAISPRWLG